MLEREWAGQSHTNYPSSQNAIIWDPERKIQMDSI